MKGKFVITVHILIVYLLVYLSSPLVVLGEEPKDKLAKTYNIHLFKEDQKLIMPTNDVSYWFNLSNGIELSDDCSVYLHFSFSQTLISNRSNLSIIINGMPIDTKWVYDLQKNTSGWWKVSVPISKLNKDGFNEIRIQSNQRSIEGDCADIDNPSNWLIIHGDSNLQITIKKEPDAKLSSYYSIYFDNFTNNNILSSDFILPASKDTSSILALLKLSSSIGKLNSNKNLLDYSVSIGTANENSNKNKVFIGPIYEWSKNALLNLPTYELGTDQGYISMSDPTSKNSNYNTLISGNNQIGVSKAIDLMANNSL
ncbi:MAG: cellulose biosynthesis cyclic di-GMP-binding regulatory protein BcsB, partial [Bacteroidales bacterium]|nr:cellulose biosynthesis cyclic di-GMP-binding regulatory protein BcsB [Bacteroidales bacterium]